MVQPTRLIACIVVALLPGTAHSYNLPPVSSRSTSSSSSSSSSPKPSPRSPTPDSLTMDRTPSALENAWSNYVLVRPGMTYDELKATTTGALAGRTPGTLRTVVLTSLLVLLAAVPYIVQNPLFIGYVLELAALSRAGVTPAEMFERTGRYTL